MLRFKRTAALGSNRTSDAAQHLQFDRHFGRHSRLILLKNSTFLPCRIIA